MNNWSIDPDLNSNNKNKQDIVKIRMLESFQK